VTPYGSGTGRPPSGNPAKRRGAERHPHGGDGHALNVAGERVPGRHARRAASTGSGSTGGTGREERSHGIIGVARRPGGQARRVVLPALQRFGRVIDI